MTTTTHHNDGSAGAYQGVCDRLTAAHDAGITVRVADRPVEGRWLTAPIHECNNRTWTISVRARTTRGTDIVYVKVGQTLTLDDDARVIAEREERDSCQALTPGCCIDHDRDHGSCEGW